jgi:hypothetical protein
MDYETKIFMVLRNFVEYGNYHGKVDNAVAAIRKKFPEKSKEEVTALFNYCVTAYNDAVPIVNEHSKHYASTLKLPAEVDIQYRKKHPQVPNQLLTTFVGWIYHWYHER